MPEEKQIEEMARTICCCYENGICNIDREPCDLYCGSMTSAKNLYEKDYRKASEVAADIIRILRAAGINEFRYPIVAEIKKKYMEGKG